MAAARADENRAMATQQGIQGIGSMVGQAIQFAPLYQKDLGAQRDALSRMQFDQDQFDAFGNVKGNKILGAEGADGFTNLDFDAIGNMKNRQFRKFKRDLSTNQRESLFYSPAYTDAYQDPFAAYQTFQSNQ
jgi:hypothetical protein